MAQTNQFEHQQQQHQQSTPHRNEAPFSLIPAIFTPFSGISSVPSSHGTNKAISAGIDEIHKLRLIIKNLHMQHAAVRQNMVFLTLQRAEKLILAARAELDSLSEDWIGGAEGPEIENPAERKRTREAIEEMLIGLRVKADGKKSEDFEVTMEVVKKSAAEALAQSDQSVNQNQELRTAPVICRQISRDIMQLIDCSVVELDAYDAHAKLTVQKYQESLDRRVAKESRNGTAPVPRPGFGEGSPPPSRRSSGAGVPVGILSNKHEKSPIDYEAFKKM